MGTVTLIFIALGLAMDAFSVAVTNGMLIKDLKFKNALKIGAFFGVFQGIMPCIGYALGMSFIKYIEQFDHWIAFVLLAIIGMNMIFEAFRGDGEKKEEKNPLSFKVLLMLAIATSIDALAVGISLASVGDVSIWISATIIGVITFVLSVAGVYIGRKSGDLFGNKAVIAGGIVLIGIGAKILIEHLFF